LADKLAQEVVRHAQGRAVELLPSVDATGRGARLGLDLDVLVRARLDAEATLAAEGDRLQVWPVVAEVPGRLIVSARLLVQPGERLRDVISVSIETDAAVLALAVRPPAASGGSVDVLASSESPPLPGRVLDLAFVGAERLLALGEDELTLFRWDGETLVTSSRRRLSGPLEPVRHAGGLLRAVERERSVWAATSRAGGATLFGVEEETLAPRQRAEALPWPGAGAGLRFRAGTDLIEGPVEGVGPGPFLHVDESGLGVDRDGRLIARGAPLGGDLRVGPTLAALWPGVVAVSTAAPPGDRDAVLVLALAPPGTAAPRVLAELPVAGAVRALAAHAAGRKARVVAAVESTPAVGSGRQTRFWVFDLGAPSAQSP
jgi:hypothetical protein